jgi:hypothetical protein
VGVAGCSDDGTLAEGSDTQDVVVGGLSQSLKGHYIADRASPDRLLTIAFKTVRPQSADRSGKPGLLFFARYSRVDWVRGDGLPPSFLADGLYEAWPDRGRLKLSLVHTVVDDGKTLPDVVYRGEYDIVDGKIPSLLVTDETGYQQIWTRFDDN